MNGFVYILKSLKNNRYYIGSTNDIKRRFAEHQNGENKSTNNLLPLRLMFYQKYPSITKAKKVESRLKKFKSRVIIEKVIKEKCIKVDS